MECKKCGREFTARHGSLYCSASCEDLAVEDWKNNPWVPYHNIEIYISPKEQIKKDKLKKLKHETEITKEDNL